MPALMGWCWFAAAVLIVSLVVHVSTFLGVDPMEEWPGVMLIHLAIFPPFIAAISYANRIGGKRRGREDRVVNSAPRWLRILTGVFSAYAIINFAIFIILVEGGGPKECDGKFLLTSHGKVLRELSESEFHQQQAYIVRGFSGHWMLFSSASLMVLLGAARLRRNSAGAPAMTPGFAEMGEVVWPARIDVRAHGAPEPITVRAGIVSLLVYVTCLAMIFSGQPALGVVAVPPAFVAMVLAVRGRGFPQRSFESCIGCLSLIPNAIIASVLGRLAAEFIYLAIFMGLGPALRHDVAVNFPKEDLTHLSNGEVLHTGVWAALMLFVLFPVLAVGTMGLTYLAEQVGRLVELRRRGQNPFPRL
jgi:hypothetical protein